MTFIYSTNTIYLIFKNADPTSKKTH